MFCINFVEFLPMMYHAKFQICMPFASGEEDY